MCDDDDDDDDDDDVYLEKLQRVSYNLFRLNVLRKTNKPSQ
jgi:hypothetical protein